MNLSKEARVYLTRLFEGERGEDLFEAFGLALVQGRLNLGNGAWVIADGALAPCKIVPGDVFFGGFSAWTPPGIDSPDGKFADELLAWMLKYHAKFKGSA